MLLPLFLHNYILPIFFILCIGVDINSPVSHVPLKLRTGVTEDRGAELFAHTVELRAAVLGFQGVELGLAEIFLWGGVVGDQVV